MTPTDSVLPAAVGALVALAAALVAPAAGGADGRLRARDSPAPVMSEADEHPYLFGIPAPRGRILDRHGEPLALSRVAFRAALALPVRPGESEASYVNDILARAEALKQSLPGLAPPDAAALADHYKHRRLIPLPLIENLEGEELEAARALEREGDHGLRVLPWWVRAYPEGKLAAHVVGYVTQGGPPARGPVRDGEFLWPEAEGRAGLEAQENDALTGVPGKLSVTVSGDGEVVGEELAVAATPGTDLVTTLDIRLQRVAEEAMDSSGMLGAMVVLDPVGGDVLAMVSRPAFDPGLFVPSVSQETFAAIRDDPNKPLFHRAASAEYPPGSIFKPVVVLGAIDRGPVSTYTTYRVKPYLEIGGRRFHNWTASDTGDYDLRRALARSQNTWFYQAAIATGDAPILWAARQLGYGSPPALGLPAVSAGRLPARAPGQQALANLSIGQGEVLATPLQAALSMAGIANGKFVPAPRVVLQLQGADAAVVRERRPAAGHMLEFYNHSLRAVHDGLFEVVNGRRGTGRAARLGHPDVFGKTGTAQWKGGSYLAWFAGFIKESDPALAFAVVLEGEPDEEIYGGSTAAPVMAAFLEKVFAAPAEFGIGFRQDTDLAAEGAPAEVRRAIPVDGTGEAALTPPQPQPPLPR